MVAKHRRSEDPSLASVGARAQIAEFGPETAAYGQVTAWSAGNGYPASDDGYSYQTPGDGYGYQAPGDGYGYQAPGDGYGYQAPGDYGDAPAEPSWQDWPGWDSPPALHPDHPSAPVPRVQFPADHPSGPMPAARGPVAPSPRGPGRQRDSGRHQSVTATAAMGYLTVRREVIGHENGNDLPRRQSGGYQQVGPGVRESDYPGQAGQFVQGAEPEGDWFRDNRAADDDRRWTTGPLLTQADDAAAIREAAERDAAAIRETAEREAAELRARLDMLLGDLGRVVADYVTDTLGTPELSAPPARRGIEQARPGATSAPPTAPPARKKADKGLPGATAAAPTTMPPPPDTAPGTRPAQPRAKSAGPRTAPNRAPTKPAGKPATKQQRQGRQKSAWRVAKYGTAAALIFALGSAGYMIADHGYGFFVFRENGQGDTPNVQPGRAGDNRLDSTFLAQQAAAKAKAAHQGSTGRHAKTSSASGGTTATNTTGG